MKKKTIISIVIGVIGALLIGLGIYFRGNDNFNITVLGAMMIAIGIPVIILNFLANKKNNPVNLRKSLNEYFEKHDLLKISSILIIISILLTWFIQSGYFDTSAMEMSISSDMSRIGVLDIFTYSYLSVYYFTVLVTFVFVVGGFYGVLSKSNGYQNLIEGLTKRFKSKEKLLVIISMIFFALLSAFVREKIVLLIFAPFFITLILNVTKDKMLAFVSTFGGILVGIIGELTSFYVLPMNQNQLTFDLVTVFGVEYSSNTLIKILLFVISLALLIFFTIMYINKNKKSKTKDEKTVDVFETLKPKNKKGTMSTGIILAIFAVITVLAYIPWEGSFGLTWPTTFHTWLIELKLFGAPVFDYLLGSVNAFGNWDLFTIQSVMAITAILIALFSRFSLNNFIESFAEGMKKMTKTVVVLVFVYLIIEFAISFPVLPTIFEWLMHLTEKFSYILATIVAFIASLFGVEMQYALQLSGMYLASEASDATALAVIYQVIYGFCAFFAPSSLALMLGLSYLDIPYKKWFKFIWKFLLIMLAVVILVIVFTV